MRKLQARNVPEDLHERVAAAADRNSRSLEGEVRHALMQQYPPEGSEKPTLRQQWQNETASRLRTLVGQLKADGFWYSRGPGTHVQLSQNVGEESPARFLDWLDGNEPLPFEAAERIASFTGCSKDWLMDGIHDPFPIADTGTPAAYKAFFSPEEKGDYRYHLIRFANGTLSFIRHDRQSGSWAIGYTGGQFFLADGMGGGNDRLKHFLTFLKNQGQRLRIDSHDSRESDDELGKHHPCWFVKDEAHTRTDWLPQLLQGKLPERWESNAGDLRYILKEFSSNDPKKSLVDRVRSLVDTLENFDIYSEQWPAFNDGYVELMPTGGATYTLFLKQLENVAIKDRLMTLHDKTQEAESRRHELQMTLQEKHDFPADAALRFILAIQG